MSDEETQQPEPAEAPTAPIEGSVPAPVAAEPSPPTAAAVPPTPAPMPSEPEPVVAPSTPPTTTASGLPNPYGLPDIAVDRPEIAAGAAFGGGLVLALILKRLVR